MLLTKLLLPSKLIPFGVRVTPVPCVKVKLFVVVIPKSSDVAAGKKLIYLSTHQ